MTMQLGTLRDALMSRGHEAKANKAAEEAAAYKSQFASIKVDLSAIRGELALMKWILTSVLVVVLTVVLRLFLH